MNMKRFFGWFLALFAIVPMLAASCHKEPVTPDPDPKVPTSITCSPAAIEAEVEGGAYQITITAPTRPKISGLPSWVTLTDGTYKDYKITVTFTVATNYEYSDRSADVKVSSTGVPDVTLAVSQKGRTIVPDPEPGNNDAWQMSKKLGLGWNMGNHFDAFYNYPGAGDKFLYPSETVWGGELATQATFDGVAAAGFTSVRIPVTWLKMIGDAPDYTIDATWLNRVYEVVQYAHNAGLYVIINTHHDENHHSITDDNGIDIDTRWLDIKNAATNSTLNAQIKEEISAFWKQVANKFADCGEWLILESFNEINDGGWGWSTAFKADPTKQCNVLNEWNQVFVDAVRSTGGNNATRWLGVPSYAANAELTKYMAVPEDPAGRIMISVHFYDPSDYTIGAAQYSDWGHTAAAGKKAAGGDEEHVKEIFGNLFSKYVDKNIPCYIGEFGCSVRNKADSRAWAFYLYYLEYVVKAAKIYGLPCLLWDNGATSYGQEQHGYINHGTGAYIGNSKEAIDKMVKARFNEDKGYTLQSVYDSAPTF